MTKLVYAAAAAAAAAIFYYARSGIKKSSSPPPTRPNVMKAVTVDGTVAIRETDQLEGRLVSVDELRSLLADEANFETWSSFLIPHLDQLVPETITT